MGNLAAAAAAKRKPPPSLFQAATSQVNQELAPIIQGLTDASHRQTLGASQAIQGLTGQYAQALGQIDPSAPYGPAVQQQAAVDAALQESLTGAGSDLASQLAAHLAALQGSSGAPAVEQAGQQIAGMGASAGTTRLASGSDALGNLIANAASAKSYGEKLPGIARLAGLGNVGRVEAAGTNSLNKSLSDLAQKEPGLVNETVGKLQAGQRLGLEAQNQSFNQGAKRVELAQGQARIGQGQQRINIAASRAAQTALNENRSYGIALSRLGIEGKRLQLEALTQETKLRNGGLSPSEVSRYRAVSFGLASQAFHSQDKTTGTPITYQEALSTITEKGVPVSIAMKALNRAGYKPGVRGTPYPAGTGLFSGLTGAIKTGGQSPFAGAASAVQTAAAHTIVGLARQYQGTPYVWGGESPKGFDCSGFAQYLYGKAGIAIPRTTYTQWTASNGHPVPAGQLEPGDLVFYKGSDSIVQGGRVLPGHVGIYLGNGKIMDAYGTGYGVRIDQVNSPALGGYMGARRFGKG